MDSMHQPVNHPIPCQVLSPPAPGPREKAKTRKKPIKFAKDWYDKAYLGQVPPGPPDRLFLVGLGGPTQSTCLRRLLLFVSSLPVRVGCESCESYGVYPKLHCDWRDYTICRSTESGEQARRQLWFGNVGRPPPHFDQCANASTVTL